MKLHSKDGRDGAGQQATWKSVSMKEAAPNMFQYNIIPLQVINNNEVPWKNPSQNPADLLRPVFLIREIENDQEPLNLVIPTTVYARTNLNENDILIIIYI